MYKAQSLGSSLIHTIPAPHQRLPCLEDTALLFTWYQPPHSGLPCVEDTLIHMILTWVNIIAAQHSPVHPTTKPLKPLCQFLSAWENYSENLTLVTRCDRAWVRPSIQMQTTLFQRCGAVSNIASKCPGPETRAMQPARKRSNRTNPGERAGK